MFSNILKCTCTTTKPKDWWSTANTERVSFCSSP